jgi:hypothetical protein
MATTTAVASSTTTVKTSAGVEATSTTSMIELRMMAAAAPMVFPRMVGDEDGIVATPIVSVWRVAIPGVTLTVVATVVIAAARGECDRAEQNQRSDRSSR